MTVRLLTVIGARPQFIKAATVCRAVSEAANVDQVLVHTGQHFDPNMSDVFFEEMEIPRPQFHLGIGGGSHGQNTGRMIEAIERVLLAERPDWVLVYGDTDSTLAGAVAAVKLNIPVAHVEAGLRSFNRRMPEEVNRVLTDHASTLLFAPTSGAINNLAAEGLSGGNARLVGDVMYDAALFYGNKAERESSILSRLGLYSGEYVLLTIHRPSNTDDRERLAGLLDVLSDAACSVVWPLHPRARLRLSEFALDVPNTVRVIDPVGYLDMVMLERNARLVATDSGGVQKEAYFQRVPCVTLRDETEWVELLAIGANRLAGRQLDVLRESLRNTPTFPRSTSAPPLYGDGSAARHILAALQSFTGEDS